MGVGSTHSFRNALVFAAVVALAFSARAQPVENGSFERDGEFSLSSWRISGHVCFNEDRLHEGAPAQGAGKWALKVPWQNVQAGCMAAAYQLLPEVQDGEVWRLSAWARQPEERERRSATPARIYWTTFEPAVDTSGRPYLYYPGPHGTVDSTRSTEWVRLSATDTLRIAEADSVGVVLDPGGTGGQTFLTDWTAFDSVTVERIEPVGTEGPARDRGFLLHPASPNPFGHRTQLPFELPRTGPVTLRVYDVLGREVASLVDEVLPAGEHAVTWEAEGLPAGVYVVWLESGGAVAMRRLTLVR